jgi:hypothetical protein
VIDDIPRFVRQSARGGQNQVTTAKQASECYIADDIAAKEAWEKLQSGEWDLWAAVIWLRSSCARNYRRKSA